MQQVRLTVFVSQSWQGKEAANKLAWHIKQNQPYVATLSNILNSDSLIYTENVSQFPTHMQPPSLTTTHTQGYSPDMEMKPKKKPQTIYNNCILDSDSVSMKKHVKLTVTFEEIFIQLGQKIGCDHHLLHTNHAEQLCKMPDKRLLVKIKYIQYIG